MAETTKPEARNSLQPKRKRTRKELQAIRLAETAGVPDAERELCILLTISPALLTRLRAADLADLVRFNYGNRIALQAAVAKTRRDADELRARLSLRPRLRTLLAAFVAGLARLTGGRS
jgi:hypothetical protein